MQPHVKRDEIVGDILLPNTQIQATVLCSRAAWHILYRLLNVDSFVCNVVTVVGDFSGTNG